MRAAARLKWRGAWVLVSLVVLAPAVASAAETGGPCDPAAKNASRWSEKECERLRSTPTGARTVVYQDAVQTVLVERSSIVRNASAVEALLIIDNHRAADGKQGVVAPRSQVRRQRIDCSTRQQAVLELTNYDEPVGRGVPGAIQRTPAAPMKPLVNGSVDARVAAVLCATAKEG